MAWPEGIDPLSLSDFESRARRNRYRMLAQLAVRNGIRGFFLGHHQDDQVETILMRMIRTEHPTSFALQGMIDMSSMPYCDDIWGVHSEQRTLLVEQVVSQSMERQTLPSYSRFLKTMPPSNTPINTLDGKIRIPGGSMIGLYRPLLGFSKASLVETCKQNSVPYIVDPTNADPKLTMRNAVRHLRNTTILPRALGSERILQLRRRSVRRVEETLRAGEDLARSARILSMDLRSGTAVIRLPDTIPALLGSSPAMVGNALSRILRLVSPIAHDESSSILSEAMLAHLQQSGALLGPRAGHVVPEAQRGSPYVRVTAMNKVLIEASHQHLNGDLWETTWQISRQPMREAESEAMENSFELIQKSTLPRLSEQEDDTVLPRTMSEHQRRKSMPWSKHVFWDNRYWMRVQTQETANLQAFAVRPYCKDDVPSVEARLKKHDMAVWRSFSSIVSNTARGKIRYTLPVITHNHEVCAFPSLGIRIPCRNGKYNSLLVDFEVTYKKIGEPFAKT